MRVLLADRLPDAARLRLMGAGFTVHADATLSGDALRDALAAHQPDVLVVRSTKVTAAHLGATSGLQLVVRAGAGVNTIDLDAASALGVFVSNCPGMNAVAVAELTFGHILNADRRIAEQVADLRAGQWRKKAYGTLQGRGLKGRTLGVLGCGNIGRAVIARALAFEMEVIAWSPSL
ncbi:MAG: D-3-phosphoglycerate dehydrogenase, partial [Bradymonadia bacterium]